jgi:hypothetical protein
MTSLSSIARAILAVPKNKRLGMILDWPEEMQESIKKMILLIHSGQHVEPPTPAIDRGALHKGFRIYLHGKRGSVPMIDGDGASMTEALNIARWQFGDKAVSHVVTGEDDRK